VNREVYTNESKSKSVLKEIKEGLYPLSKLLGGTDSLSAEWSAVEHSTSHVINYQGMH